MRQYLRILTLVQPHVSFALGGGDQNPNPNVDTGIEYGPTMDYLDELLNYEMYGGGMPSYTPPPQGGDNPYTPPPSPPPSDGPGPPPPGNGPPEQQLQAMSSRSAPLSPASAGGGYDRNAWMSYINNIIGQGGPEYVGASSRNYRMRPEQFTENSVTGDPAHAIYPRYVRAIQSAMNFAASGQPISRDQFMRAYGNSLPPGFDIGELESMGIISSAPSDGLSTTQRIRQAQASGTYSPNVSYASGPANTSASQAGPLSSMSYTSPASPLEPRMGINPVDGGRPTPITLPPRGPTGDTLMDTVGGVVKPPKNGPPPADGGSPPPSGGGPTIPPTLPPTTGKPGDLFSGGSSGARQLTAQAAYNQLFKTLANPGFSDAEKNAMAQEAANAARAQYAGAGGQILRHAATTGNRAGVAAGLSQLARGEAGTLSEAARRNAIEQGREAQRQREWATGGMGQMYGAETSYLSNLFGQRADLAARPRGTGIRQRRGGEGGTTDFLNPTRPYWGRVGDEERP